MAKVILRTGETVLLDECDLHILESSLGYSRKTMAPSSELYVQVATGTMASGYHRMEYLHRIIMDAPKGTKVDHINFSGLDNRRCNLRLATSRQNVQHRRKFVITSSRFKGAALMQDARCLNKPWRSTIFVNGKQVQLGYFSNEMDAARAYDYAAKLHFGDFAHLNFRADGTANA